MVLSKSELSETERRIYDQQLERGVKPLVILQIFGMLRKRKLAPDLFNFDVIDPSLSQKEQLEQARAELRKYGLTEEDLAELGKTIEEEEIKEKERRYVISEFEKQAGLEPGLLDEFKKILAEEIADKVLEKIKLEIPRKEEAPVEEIEKVMPPYLRKKLAGAPSILKYTISSKKFLEELYETEREILNEEAAAMQARLSAISLDYIRRGIAFDPIPRERERKVVAFDSFLNLVIEPNRELMERFIKEAIIPEYIFNKYIVKVTVSNELVKEIEKEYGVFKHFGYVSSKKYSIPEISDLTGIASFDIITFVDMSDEIMLLRRDLTKEELQKQFKREKDYLRESEAMNEKYREQGRKDLIIDIELLKVDIILRQALISFLIENYDRFNSAPKKLRFGF